MHRSLWKDFLGSPWVHGKESLTVHGSLWKAFLGSPWVHGKESLIVQGRGCEVSLPVHG